MTECERGDGLYVDWKEAALFWKGAPAGGAWRATFAGGRSSRFYIMVKIAHNYNEAFTFGTIEMFCLINRCLSGGSLNPYFSWTRGRGMAFFFAANIAKACIKN